MATTPAATVVDLLSAAFGQFRNPAASLTRLLPVHTRSPRHLTSLQVRQAADACRTIFVTASRVGRR